MVGKKPIHLMKEDDRKRVPQLKDLHIDLGAPDGDEARRLVRIGDVAVIAAEPVEFPNDRFVSRSMDNRIGCFVALEAARLVAEAGGAPGDVYALAVTQEEITFGGARTTAFSLNPDVAIAVDVTFATDQPGIYEQELGRHPFGSGPVLTRGSTLDPTLFELLHEAAEAEGIPFTVTASARATGTDADAFHIARAGIPTQRRLRPAALHALAGGDGAARRRRERGEADRGLRAAAARPTPTSSAEALLLLFDIDGTLLQRASRRARAGAARGGGRGARRRPARHRRRRVRGAHGSRDRARPARRRRRGGDRRAADDVRARRAAYERLCPADLSAKVAPGIVELLEELAARPDEFRLSLVTGNLEPVARLKLARGRRRALLRGRPGRLRLRRRGPRAAAGDRARRAPPIRRGRASARS